MEFNNNPLRGVHMSGRNGKEGNKYIVDSSGNPLLKRSGISWDEKDQIGYDLFMKSMDYEYQADLLNFQNDYNSAASQVKRLRDAGLNPDFQNITQNPSASSSASAPSTQLNEGQANARKIGYAQQFLELIPEALQLYGSMKSTSQSLEMNQLNIDSKLQDMATRDAIDAFSPDDFDSNGVLKDSSRHKLSDFVDRRLLSFGYDYNNKHNSRSVNRRVKQYNLGLNNLVSGNYDRLRAGVYNKGRDAASNRSDYIGLLGQHGFNLSDDDFVSVLREFNDIVFSADKKDASNRNLRADKNVALKLISKGQNKISEGQEFVGYLLYFLGALMESGVNYSRSSGPKGISQSFGF